MWVQRPYDPAFCERIVSLAAAQGLDRSEVATALGASLKDFDAWAESDAAFAVALADADTRSDAWWHTQRRLALQSDKPHTANAWTRALAQRQGRSAHSSRRIEKAPARSGVLARSGVRVRYDIPDNGKERRPAK
ncbi:MAG TPA: hypothetical protein VN806_07390 [Caulobacteraceae bacterium]|nr:hypothetical protein [Caulobacteraceae bacterium]